MELELQGKTALVSGAASGIGRATAIGYAREGANVVLSDIDGEGCQKTLELMGKANAQAKGIIVHADAGKAEDHEKTVRAALDAFGGLDAACNNAGIGGESNPVNEMSVAGWNKVIEVNLSGVFYAMRAQLAHMNRGGSIVNIASILGQAGWATAAAYVASKHGVVGLTRTAALEYAEQGIRINAVGPGFIETPILGEDRAVLDSLAQLHPVKRLGKPDEVADLVMYLSSARASLITGAYYPVDGGYLAK